MNNNRLEELLINIFEWAINVSEQLSLDMVKASGITSDELRRLSRMLSILRMLKMQKPQSWVL